MDVLSKLNWSPLFVSLKTGFISTVIIFFLGTAAACAVMRLRPRVKWLIDSILTVPLVLPPTAAGYLLLLLFSLRRPVGSMLMEKFNISFVQTQLGCIAAATVIAFPLMYRNARAAFEQLDVNLLHAGRTLGMSETKIFFKVLLPAAAPGLCSGTILAFARAIGEYGATTMLAGNILGKTRTMAVAIAAEVSGGNFEAAGIWVAVLIIIAFIVVFASNLITGRGMKHICDWRYN
jgi:molybdate transport system permease protein